MHVAGLLGGAFGMSLAVASAILVVRLALVAVEGVTIARLVIASQVVVAIALPIAVHSLVGNMLEFVVVDFCGIRDEIRDRSIERELDSQGARILVDFGLVFDMRIVALQLVNLGELCLSVPFPR